MSELINTHDNRTTIRWKLLTGVSALALTAYVSSTGIAGAADADQPQVWIELGGQLQRLSGSPEIFSPPFFNLAPSASLAPMTEAQKPAPYAVASEGKISFAPENSDWVLSAAIRYGRSNSSRHLHHQTKIPTPIATFFGSPHPSLFSHHNSAFGDGQSRLAESHVLIDFQAGKDIGLGMFGAHGSSVISAGVRFAQFTSGSNVSFHARPVLDYVQVSGLLFGFITYNEPFPHHATYTAVLRSSRESRGVGPSISWDASLPFAGNGADSTLSFDWGVNAALLFGRQRARVHHQTTGYHYSKTGRLTNYTIRSGSYAHGPFDHTRSRNVTIPNVGGFAGISFKYADAKVSFGYRGDFFFGAMDTGIDTRKETTLGFFGPYASISVGLGD